MPDKKSGFWANAFKLPTEEKLTQEEEAWLDEIAEKLKERKLETAAAIFFESTIPLHFVTSQALHAAKPILGFVVPDKKMDMLSELLSKKGAAEKLIEKLHKETPHPTSPTRREEKNGEKTKK
ncbi:hypothetical protein ACFL6Y_06910 [Elusimicrobiota bacterium]